MPARSVGAPVCRRILDGVKVRFRSVILAQLYGAGPKKPGAKSGRPDNRNRSNLLIVRRKLTLKNKVYFLVTEFWGRAKVPGRRARFKKNRRRDPELESRRLRVVRLGLPAYFFEGLSSALMSPKAY
jgi:hypothetical protein